ncbi:MAG: ABC transporter permease [Legionella sp.]|nr:ABC transporter permease [Legionella sp.]
MSAFNTMLNQQEIQWILEARFTRFTDNREVQIYPMGAERYLFSKLLNDDTDIHKAIQGKHLLVIPGFGNSGFLFAKAGAKSVRIVDKDPVTIAWVKAFKKYYHYRERDETYPSIGQLLTALTAWNLPFMILPSGNWLNKLFWLCYPNALRQVYIHYMLKLAQQAVKANHQGLELEHDIQFYAGTVDEIKSHNLTFDMAYVPYLLGVKNGIESEPEIAYFMEAMYSIVPKGTILVTPSRNTKEFNLIGTRYFETTGFECIQDLPKLKPHFIKEDKQWYRTQGMAWFSSKELSKG